MEDKQPAISFILPVYNTREIFLRDCLDSIAAQTFRDFEVVCVNNGSQDPRCGEILDEYARKDERFQVVTLEENRLAGGGRNAGLRHARGKYLLFADTDDTVSPDLCEIAYNEAELSAADIVVFDFLDIRGEQKVFCLGGYSDVDLDTDKGKIILVYRSLCWNKIWNRRFVVENKITFPEGLYGEDLYFCWLGMIHAGKVTRLNDALYFRRHHTESASYTDEQFRFDVFPVLDRIQEQLLERNMFDRWKTLFTENKLVILHRHLGSIASSAPHLTAQAEKAAIDSLDSFSRDYLAGTKPLRKGSREYFNDLIRRHEATSPPPTVDNPVKPQKDTDMEPQPSKESSNAMNNNHSSERIQELRSYFRFGGTFDMICASLNCEFDTVLDIGFGKGGASLIYAESGKKVTAIGLEIDSYDVPDEVIEHPNITIQEAFFEKFEPGRKFEAILASHVMEHTQNHGLFLRKCHELLEDDGWLFILLPVHSHLVVGGHVNVGWNLGTLMYNLLLSGFDIKTGHFASDERHNICAFVRKSYQTLPKLRYDNNDIETLSSFFPFRAKQAFNGNIKKINWPPRTNEEERYCPKFSNEPKSAKPPSSPSYGSRPQGSLLKRAAKFLLRPLKPFAVRVARHIARNELVTLENLRQSNRQLKAKILEITKVVESLKKTKDSQDDSHDVKKSA